MVVNFYKNTPYWRDVQTKYNQNHCLLKRPDKVFGFRLNTNLILEEYEDCVNSQPVLAYNGKYNSK